jgi:hypothetical protein
MILFGNKQHIFELALHHDLVSGGKFMQSLLLENSIQSLQRSWRGKVLSGAVSSNRRNPGKDDQPEPATI